MAEETTSAAGAVPSESTGTASKGKGLAEYGYSRAPKQDYDYLNSLLTPLSEQDVSTELSPSDAYTNKIKSYAVEREGLRNTRIENNIADYLADTKTSNATKNIYKDLYDAYLATQPEEAMSREAYLRQLTGLSGSLSPTQAKTAMDTRLAEYSDSPTSFLDNVRNSGINYGVEAEKFATSAAIGDVLGWDSGAYDRAFNASGLEDFAAMSRTVRSREEAARKAELARLKAQQQQTTIKERDGSGDRGGYGASGIGMGGSGVGARGLGGGDATGGVLA